MSYRSTAVAVLLMLGVFAQPAAAADWTVKPAPNSFGADRESYRYTINPSAQLEDGVVVTNHGAATLHLDLSATGRTWVHLDQHELIVPPDQSVQVPFSITVPDGAAAGDHAGGIVTAEGKQRVSVPLLVRVGGPLKPSLAVEDVHVHGSSVSYTLHNTGNAILSARAIVTVSGPFGLWKATSGKPAASPAVLPGGRWKTSVAVPGMRPDAKVKVVPLLTDAAGSIAPLPAVTASGHSWTLLWVALLIVVACAGAFAGLRSRRRARTSRAGSP